MNGGRIDRSAASGLAWMALPLAGPPEARAAETANETPEVRATRLRAWYGSEKHARLAARLAEVWQSEPATRDRAK